MPDTIEEPMNEDRSFDGRSRRDVGVTLTDDSVGIPRDAAGPVATTFRGRIIIGRIEGLEGIPEPDRGAAGSVVTIDVPASATVLE